MLCDDPERPGKKRQVIVGTLTNHKQEQTEQASHSKTEDNNNKRDIPVPTITIVRQYERDVPPDFEVPQSYIRYNHPSYEEADAAVEYNIDQEDEIWWKNDEEFGPCSKAKVIWEGDAIESDPDDILQTLSPSDVIAQNPRYFMSSHGTYWLIEKHRPRLPLYMFEKMMDVLEKATGFETIVTVAQAETLLVKKIPMLTEIFSNEPPVIEKARYHNEGIAIQSSSDAKPPARIPAFAPPITLPAAIYKVYNYWMLKRSRLKKPLLRRFWPATSSSDVNPHMVFRPRDKEKRKLRKKRQNDVESYKKVMFFSSSSQILCPKISLLT